MADQKTTVPGLYRSENGLLISKDSDALHAYKIRKRKFNQIDDLEKRVAILEETIKKLNGSNNNS